MSDTTTDTTVQAPTAAPATPPAAAKPDIIKQAQDFLNALPARRQELAKLRIQERTADQALFEAKRTLLQAQEAVKLADPTDPQLSEHEHFAAQAAEAVTAAHNTLQQARLAICTTETALHKDQAAADLLTPLRQAVAEHSTAQIEKYLRDFNSSGFQKTLQRGRALADALNIRLDAPVPANAPAAVKDLITALTQVPDVSGWADNPAAQGIFDANKSPSLMLHNLEQHSAISKRWLDARYHPTNIKGGFDSAGAFRVITALTLRGREYPRGSYVTLASVDPAGTKEGIVSLKRLVSNGQITLALGSVENQQQQQAIA